MHGWVAVSQFVLVVHVAAPPVEMNTSSRPGHSASVHPKLGLDTPEMQFTDHDVDAAGNAIVRAVGSEPDNWLLENRKFV